MFMFFFFKQKTAYEMRISDWSSDVCSSDLLRLSLTEVCNFRCTYCLPDGYKKPCQRPAELTVEEIRRAVTAFAQLGVWKVRLTGGEPTLRRDFENVARAVSSVPGIRRVAMPTHGHPPARLGHAGRGCRGV